MKSLPLLTSLVLCGGTLALFVSALAQTPAPNLGTAALKSPPLGKKIVLIGSPQCLAAGEKTVSNAIPLLAALLKASPVFAGADVLTYTTGWPTDPTVLEGASGIVCYGDIPPPPILKQLTAHDTGIVRLRAGDGAAVTATLTLQPASPEHAVSSGVSPFTSSDEFFSSPADGNSTTPILRSEQGGKTIAWAYATPGGGRGFEYTGGNSLVSPSLQKLLVNAIAWTAKIDVPKDGTATPEPIVPSSQVNKIAENKVTEMPWGQLRWYTSAELKNSRTMTTGVAIIKPGKSNPRHFHPNCDEVLHVVSGKISHTMNEVTVEMNAGDTVSIPQGVLHNATNIGSQDAVLAISFSSAYREAVGY